MKTISLISLLSAAILLLSCSKNETSLEGNTSSIPVEVKFSGINVKAKASNGNWDSGDQIGIYVIYQGDMLQDATIVDHASNRTYQTSGTGAAGLFYPASDNQKIFFPDSGEAVDFIAYYPYKATGTGAGEINNYQYPLNVSDQSNPAAIDFLFSNDAKAKSKDTAPPVQLTFNHKLTKIVFTMVPESGKESEIGDITAASTTVTIKCIAEGTFNLTTQAITLGGTVQDVVCKRDAGSNIAEAILIPGNTTGKIVVFKIGAKEYTWNINKELEEGKVHNYTVTITPSTSAILEGDIVNWNPVDEGGVIAK